MTREQCGGFKAYPPNEFYAVKWRQWQHFFDPKYTNATLELTKDSLVIHVWNKKSINEKVKVGGNAAYGIVASRHCPKVYQSCGEYFWMNNKCLNENILVPSHKHGNMSEKNKKKKETKKMCNYSSGQFRTSHKNHLRGQRDILHLQRNNLFLYKSKWMNGIYRCIPKGTIRRTAVVSLQKTTPNTSQ